jgi:hypothetical protein
VDHGETSSPSNPSNVIIPKGKKKKKTSSDAKSNFQTPKIATTSWQVITNQFAQQQTKSWQHPVLLLLHLVK